MISSRRPPGAGTFRCLLVLLASFLNSVLLGSQYSVGVWNAVFLVEFRAGSAATAWISSVFFTMTCLAGLCGGLLCKKFSCRMTLIFGSILCTAGCILASLCSSVNTLIITFGFLTGTGMGIVYIPNSVILSEYFNRFFGAASALSLSGLAVGQSFAAFYLQLLLENFSWSQAMLLYGGILLQMCVISSVMTPNHQGRVYSATGVRCLAKNLQTADVDDKVGLNQNTDYKVRNFKDDISSNDNVHEMNPSCVRRKMKQSESSDKADARSQIGCGMGENDPRHNENDFHIEHTTESQKKSSKKITNEVGMFPRPPSVPSQTKRRKSSVEFATDILRSVQPLGIGFYHADSLYNFDKQPCDDTREIDIRFETKIDKSRRHSMSTTTTTENRLGTISHPLDSTDEVFTNVYKNPSKKRNSVSGAAIDIIGHALSIGKHRRYSSTSTNAEMSSFDTNNSDALGTDHNSGMHHEPSIPTDISNDNVRMFPQSSKVPSQTQRRKSSVGFATDILRSVQPLAVGFFHDDSLCNVEKQPWDETRETDFDIRFETKIDKSRRHSMSPTTTTENRLGTINNPHSSTDEVFTNSYKNPSEKRNSVSMVARDIMGHAFSMGNNRRFSSTSSKAMPSFNAHNNGALSADHNSGVHRARSMSTNIFNNKVRKFSQSSSVPSQTKRRKGSLDIAANILKRVQPPGFYHEDSLYNAEQQPYDEKRETDFGSMSPTTTKENRFGTINHPLNSTDEVFSNVSKNPSKKRNSVTLAAIDVMGHVFTMGNNRRFSSTSTNVEMSSFNANNNDAFSMDHSSGMHRKQSSGGTRSRSSIPCDFTKHDECSSATDVFSCVTDTSNNQLHTQAKTTNLDISRGNKGKDNLAFYIDTDTGSVISEVPEVNKTDTIQDTLNLSYARSISSEISRKEYADDVGGDIKWWSFLRGAHRYLCFCASVFFFFLGLTAVYVHLPADAQANGLTEHESGVLVMYSGMGTLVGRILIAILTAFLYSERALLILSVIPLGVVGVMSLAFPFFKATYGTYVSYSITFGALGNLYFCFFGPVSKALVGKINIHAAYGLVLTTCGISALFGPSLAGFLFDATGSYHGTFYVGGVSFCLSCLLDIVILLTKQKRSEEKHSSP